MLPAQVPQTRLKLRGHRNYLSRFRLHWLLRRLRPDVVQTYLGRAAKLTRVPLSMPTVHVTRLGGFYDLADFRYADTFIGISRGLCDYIVRAGVPAARVFHAPNFVNAPKPAEPERLAALRQRLGIPPDALVVFAIGRFVAKKGFDDFLDACARLPTHIGHRPLRFLIGGDGVLGESLRRQSASLRLQDRVQFLGWVEETDSFYQLADLVVVPSRHEPLGHIVQEAWNYAKPVVSTLSEGPAEIAVDGEDVLFCPPSSPELLAARIHEALSAPPADLQRLGEAGRKKLLDRYSQEIVVQTYLDIYHAAIRLGRRSASP
jgi:glycosyltransferase involved in cell wall biosynthesis